MYINMYTSVRMSVQKGRNLMGRKNIKHKDDTVLSAGNTQVQTGLGAVTLVKSYQAGIDALWDHELLRHRAGLRPALKVGIADEKPKTRDEPLRLEPEILENAISVTKARNTIGMGRILDQAQDAVQVLRNDRTEKHAYVIGPGVMEQIFEEQVVALQDKIIELQSQVEANTEATRVAEARAGFFNLSKAFEPIEADVPIVEGTPPSAAIEF